MSTEHPDTIRRSESAFVSGVQKDNVNIRLNKVHLFLDKVKRHCSTEFPSIFSFIA